MTKKKGKKAEVNQEFNGDDELSFEESLEQLEQIAAQLEDGELGLTESLEKYEEAVHRLRRCHQLLQQAKQKIELLAGVDEEGRPKTTPFDEKAMSLEEKAAARSRRRTHSDVDSDDALF